MVSTRQSSNVGSGDGVISTIESGGVKTRHSIHSSSKSAQVSTLISPSEIIPVAECRPSVSSVNILDLPPEIFYKIFKDVGYKNVSQMRLVCRQFNLICSSVLNSTFQRLQTQMLQRFQGIKSKMPRRESARRTHPLACESDIIETLHMRLTLLQMSFGKHIERKHCCFFAGEILDEVYRILHYIKVTPKLSRPYRVTDELFDLSTMAMEYFKEHIEPTLPEISYFGTDFLDFSTSSGLATSSSKKTTWVLDSPPYGGNKSEYESPSAGEGDSRPETNQVQATTVLRKKMRRMQLGMKKYSSKLEQYKRELKSCKAKVSQQQKQFHEMISRMDDNDKKNDETARKFSALLQELNKCKTELQYWKTKSALASPCAACNSKMGEMMERAGWSDAGGNNLMGPNNDISNNLASDLDTSIPPPPVALTDAAHAAGQLLSSPNHSGGGVSPVLPLPNTVLSSCQLNESSVSAQASEITASTPISHPPAKRKVVKFNQMSFRKGAKKSRLDPLKTNQRTRRN